MTLEQLRPLLAHYDTAGAVLRVLEFGSFTAMGLVEATGKGRRAVYAALATLEAAQLVQKTAQGGVQNPALAYQLSAKSCTPPVQNSSLPPESSAENCTDNPLSVQKTAQGEGVQKTAQAQNIVQDEEDDECKKLHSPENDVNSLKSLSINSLREKDLKDKEQLKPEPRKKTRAKKIKEEEPMARTPKPRREDYERLLEAYNAHRRGLPYAKTLTAERERKLLMLIEDHGVEGAIQVLELATRCISQPGGWYEQHGYGLDNLLRESRCSRVIEYAEKWQAEEARKTQAKRHDPRDEYRGLNLGLREEVEAVQAVEA